MRPEHHDDDDFDERPSLAEQLVDRGSWWRLGTSWRIAGSLAIGGAVVLLVVLMASDALTGWLVADGLDPHRTGPAELARALEAGTLELGHWSDDAAWRIERDAAGVVTVRRLPSGLEVVLAWAAAVLLVRQLVELVRELWSARARTLRGFWQRLREDEDERLTDVLASIAVALVIAGFFLWACLVPVRTVEAGRWSERWTLLGGPTVWTDEAALPAGAAAAIDEDEDDDGVTLELELQAGDDDWPLLELEGESARAALEVVSAALPL